MPSSPETGPTPFFPPWRRTLLIAAVVVAGFGLTMRVFYPGVMTYDARYVYEDIAHGFYGDWQSPVMTALWALIDPIAPGSASMFLLMTTLYWLGFGLLALLVARRNIWLALALPLLAVLPPAFVFAGIIWRDVLLAALWLLAAALALAVADRGWAARVPAQIVALSLLALGVLLRPNALLAAPVLGAFILWPSQFFWKRAVMIYLPAVAGFYALIQVSYYSVLGATRQHPLQSIMVFDLGGITHFAKDNQFPVSWTPQQTALLTGQCYQPTEWNIYWMYDPCQFVMKRLEGDKIFGTDAIPAAWRRAILSHPLAYLRHRAAFMWNFTTKENLTMWTYDIDNPPEVVFKDNPAFMALKSVHDRLSSTPLYRAGTWLILCAAVCGFAWRSRGTPTGAFAFGVGASAVLYIISFFAVGVASDFRYAYWAVLAGITGAVAIALRPSAAK